MERKIVAGAAAVALCGVMALGSPANAQGRQPAFGRCQHDDTDLRLEEAEIQMDPGPAPPMLTKCGRSNAGSPNAWATVEPKFGYFTAALGANPVCIKY